MLGRLVEDPANRELIAIGTGRHDADFFKKLTARDDVLFVTPATRSINAQANAVRNRQARKLVRKVVLIPSAAGDPISTTANVAPGVATLSTRLADELEVAPGDTIEIRINRRLNNVVETATQDVVVAGIVPAENYGRSALFIAVQDMVAIERFRDDASVTAEDWAEPRAMPETFASFRLYTRSLADISALEKNLAAQGVNVRPRAQNVELLLSFQRNLNLLFVIIAALAVIGFWAAMASNLRGAVERQRTSLSLLHLLGLTESSRRLIPVTQSVILVLGGVFITLLFVLPSIVFINRFFTPEGFERIAWLGPQHLFGTFVLGLMTAITASMWAVLAIKEIKSDEVLRTS
ncbi:ABC transporter [uncultured Roseovarius sp.]|uniref:ABC transporter n=1 Tax=uncultured Roseovarius sp. TaxID=293344 RepID=UPI00260C1AAB|nr:ABC transporter [uncultured Roseovarius sp.]